MVLKFIRWFLGKIILTLNSFFPPRSVDRDAGRQAQIDQETAGLLLYEFETCPFCVKVRRSMKRMNIKIALKDAKAPEVAAELIKGGGQLQVPCLRIVESGGPVRWLYESSDIIDYFKSRSWHLA